MKRMKQMVTVLLVLTVLMVSGCGKKDGFGATQKTYFFSYKVDSAYVCSEYEGYTPEAGNQLLVASVTLKNTFGEEIEMYDTDFQAQWGGSGEDDFSLPITFNGTEEGLATLTQEQLPGVYTMAKGESRTGLLIFEVPDGYQDFSISYMEAFDDDSTGDTFFCEFYSGDQIGNRMRYR